MTPNAHRSDEVTLPPVHTACVDFPTYESKTASQDFTQFLQSMRRFQDLACSSDPDDHTWRQATAHLDALSALLEPHQAAEGIPPAGRALELPGMGSPLLPSWQIVAAGPDGTTFEGQFSRFYLGANNIVLGGVLPLLFDWLFAVANTAAGRPLSRTAYLNVDYRKATPISKHLVARAHLVSVDGRKTVLSAAMTDNDDTVLAEATTLVIARLAHHV
jgi:acyl-coenzyme A thioesterase PaaI-like protein